MILEASQNKRGFSINLRKKKASYSQIIPRGIWQSFPYKDFYMNELAFLSTLPLPIIARRKKICYNTAEPFFFHKFKELLINGIPSSNEDYRASNNLMIKRAKQINYFFDREGKNNLPASWRDSEETAVLPFSFGKDSLLTFALAKELELNPILVYINDTVSPKENSLKLQQIKRFKHAKIVVIKNELEKLNDFDFWNKAETCLSYTHMVTAFCFTVLPLVWQKKARYILLGNQQDTNLSFKGKQGHTCFPAYDQTSMWQEEQNKMIGKITKNKVTVASLIRPLTNLTITKILHTRYPEVAKYQISCDCLNINNQKRWCQTCNKCVRLYLFMLANKINPARVGFTKNMLERKYKKYYSLFSKSKTEIDCYEKSKFARDQQLLAFYLIYRNKTNKTKGYLINLFKKTLLKEAASREDELIKKFFKIYPAKLPIQPKKRRELLSIFKEELEK